MIAQTKLTTKGQMTIPSVIRDQLDLHSGDLMDVRIVGRKIVLIPRKGSLAKLEGIVLAPEKALTIEEMEEAVAYGIAEAL